MTLGSDSKAVGSCMRYISPKLLLIKTEKSEMKVVQ